MARAPRRSRAPKNRNMSFGVQVDRWAKKAKSDMEQFAVEYPQEVARQIVEATPVRTGFLRNSWYGQWIGRLYKFTNGAFYAPFVEYGTTYMRGRFFVRGVLNRKDEIAREVLRRIRS